SASMIVNPALPRWRSKVARNNFDPSRQPADPDLVTDAEAAKHDGPAAGHSGRKEADRRKGRTLIATLRQDGTERDVVRDANHPAGRAGPHQTPRRTDLGRDLGMAPQRRVAVALEQRRGLQRIGLELRARGRARNPGQQHRGEDRDDGDHAHHLEQREAVLAVHGGHWTQLAISAFVPAPPSWPSAPYEIRS